MFYRFPGASKKGLVFLRKTTESIEVIVTKRLEITSSLFVGGSKPRSIVKIK